MPENDEWPSWWPSTWREQYPFWRVWRGVSGVYYAWRLKTSPPVVVRGDSVVALRGQIDSVTSRTKEPATSDPA